MDVPGERSEALSERLVGLMRPLIGLNLSVASYDLTTVQVLGSEQRPTANWELGTGI